MMLSLGSFPRRLRSLVTARLGAVILIAAAAHAFFFATSHSRLHPQYLDADADVETNARSTISTDAADDYGHFARMLLERGAYETPEGAVTSHMPGTSLLLALSKRLCGHLALYGILQAAALLVAAWSYARHAQNFHDPVAVLAALLFFLLHPFTLYSSWTVNSDALFTVALLGSVAMLTDEKAGTARAAAGGALLGLATYFREVGLALGAGAGFSLLMAPLGRRRRCVAFALAFIGVLSPWMVRNALATGVPSPGTSKTIRLFFYASLGLGLSEFNPFDIDATGTVDYQALGRRAVEYMQAHGAQISDDPGAQFFLQHGLRNYVTRPGVQLVSLGLRAANLLRPPVARRHLVRMAPRPVATALYWGLFLAHAAFVWYGIWRLYASHALRYGPLRGMVAANVLVSLLLWAEPRYLLPFYLPLSVLAAEGLKRRLARPPDRAS